MDTFTVDTRRSWLIRVLGGNPLARSSDRIEAWSFVAAVLILAVATPFICAFGTSVYDSRAQSYAQEAQHRHPVTATAIKEGELVVAANRSLVHSAGALDSCRSGSRRRSEMARSC